jgi:hypothetical protein
LVFAIEARVPREIWLVLSLIIVLGMRLGDQAGITGWKRSLVQVIVRAGLQLIASLDRPDSGVLRVTQQPLVDLLDMITVRGGGAPR